MSQNPKKQSIENTEEAFEMIELAIDDLTLLTRAFDLINDVCAELQETGDGIENEIPEAMIH